MHDYLERSREAGITGHDMTLTAGTHTWDFYLVVGSLSKVESEMEAMADANWTNQ